ncbi:MAG: aminoglycoside phosphotransferase family protein, partial [Alphaproteobacteria bacterium]
SNSMKEVVGSDQAKEPIPLYKLLAAHWGVSLPVRTVNGGVNKGTCQVGDTWWLSRYDLSSADRALREAHLCRAIAASDRNGQPPLAVPATVPTQSGEDVLVANGAAWRITEHVPGESPDPTDLTLYPVLARGLSTFHNIAGSLDAAHAVTETSLLEDLEHHIALLTNAISSRGTGNDHTLLEEAQKALEPSLPRLHAEPKQLIHGDFSPPNLRISLLQNRTRRMTGVLDLEYASWDPVILDVATLITTLIMRSGSAPPLSCVEETLRAYQNAATFAFDASLLPAALLARKIDSYFHHRNRLESGLGSEEVFRRQATQLQTLLQFARSLPRSF